jgi:hypothetical protein
LKSMMFFACMTTLFIYVYLLLVDFYLSNASFGCCIKERKEFKMVVLLILLFDLGPMPCY